MSSPSVSTSRRLRPSDLALVYDLAAHRDEVTAAAVIAHRAKEPAGAVQARLVALAAELDAAGCPAMAYHASRIAAELGAAGAFAAAP